jgi:hypothetical protein
MDIQGYLNEIRALAASGQATEHSYRPALERLFKGIDDGLTVINEPRRLTDVGAPDFVFNRNGVSIGWCEAKDQKLMLALIATRERIMGWTQLPDSFAWLFTPVRSWDICRT